MLGGGGGHGAHTKLCTQAFKNNTVGIFVIQTVSMKRQKVLNMGFKPCFSKGGAGFWLSRATFSKSFFPWEIIGSSM